MTKAMKREKAIRHVLDVSWAAAYNRRGADSDWEQDREETHAALLALGVTDDELKELHA